MEEFLQRLQSPEVQRLLNGVPMVSNPPVAASSSSSSASTPARIQESIQTFRRVEGSRPIFPGTASAPSGNSLESNQTSRRAEENSRGTSQTFCHEVGTRPVFSRTTSAQPGSSQEFIPTSRFADGMRRCFTPTCHQGGSRPFNSQGGGSSQVTCRPLFNPKRRFPQNFPSLKCKQPKEASNRSFKRDVIFFCEERTAVLTSDEKSEFMKKKRYIFDVKFDTQMAYSAIREILMAKSNYKNISDIAIFLPVGKYLEIPPIDGDEEINGSILQRLFVHKPVYVRCFLTRRGQTNRPSFTNDFNNFDDDDNDDDYDDDYDSVRASDDYLNRDHSTREPEQRHVFTWIDENGDIYELEDVNPSKILSPSTESNSQDVRICDPINTTNGPSIIRNLKARIENNQGTILTVHDNFVVESIPENFSVLSPLKIKFIDGPGLGMTGPLKEFLRRILNEFRMDSKIFQGDDYNKSLVYNSENINKEKYVLVGKVMQVAIFNGFSPQFFCKDLYQVLMRGDNIGDVTGLNVPEEPFKTALLEIQSCNSPDDCTAVLAKHDVFALVGTITYISNDVQEKIDTVVKDVTRWYWTDRLGRPLQQLRQGLNAETDLLNLLSKHDREFLERSLCFGSWSTLTADEVFQVFSVQSQLDSSERKALTQWQKFLMKAEAGELAVSLKDIIEHISGHSSIPQIGFHIRPRLYFTDEVNVRAALCSNILEIPKGLEDTEFFLALEGAIASIEEKVVPFTID